MAAAFASTANIKELATIVVRGGIVCIILYYVPTTIYRNKSLAETPAHEVRHLTKRDGVPKKRTDI